MGKGFFITGTDTNVGKTAITYSLMQAFLQSHYRVAAMKPVASGARVTKDGLRSEDAELLMAHSSVEIPYETVNPYVYEAPISPNIAANMAGERIDVARIASLYQQIAPQVDCTFVEGVGGWMVPLNESQTVADMAEALGLPVILVVCIRLGCINHALLTCKAMQNAGVPLAGWVANIIDHDVREVPLIVNTIQDFLQTPSMGIVPPFRGNGRPTALNFLNTGVLAPYLR